MYIEPQHDPWYIYTTFFLTVLYHHIISIGCVSQLVIDGRQYYIGGEAVSIVGVDSCPTCEDNPCANEGVCQEANTEYGYRCLCRAGYTGSICENAGGDVCRQGELNDVEEVVDGWRCASTALFIHVNLVQ